MNNRNFKTLAEKFLLEMAYGLGNYSSITREDLKNLIVAFDESKKGAQPISFTSVTTPAHRKTGFPYKALFKVGQTAGMIGFDYESNVNLQRDRENKPTDFVKQQSSTIKSWLSPSIGVTHKDLEVIRYRPLNPQPSYWVVEDNAGNLSEISKEEAQKWLTPVSGAGASQGLEKEITYRTYGLDKIVAFAFQKKEYQITDVDPVRTAVFDVVKDHLKS